MGWTICIRILTLSDSLLINAQCRIPQSEILAHLINHKVLIYVINCIYSSPYKFLSPSFFCEFWLEFIHQISIFVSVPRCNHWWTFVWRVVTFQTHSFGVNLNKYYHVLMQ